ncbi:MAG: DUF7684 family protein [Planctomycetota bacterium]
MEHVSDFAHRRIWYARWEGAEGFDAPEGGREPWTCLLIGPPGGLPEFMMDRVAARLIETNARNIVIYADDADDWHESIDAAYLEHDPAVSEDEFVMTAQFDEEPIDEAIFFFLMCADFDEIRFRQFAVLEIGDNPALRKDIVHSVQSLRFLD